MKIEYPYLLRFQESILLVYLSYDLYSHLLKDLSGDFSQMPIFFSVKCWSFNYSHFTIDWLPALLFHKNFRKWWSVSTRKETLAKIALDFARFHRCKITHFSQISQAFSAFSSFSMIIHFLVLSRYAQSAQNEVFAEISFFANDFAYLLYQ